MKKDVIRMSPLDLRPFPLELPAFVLGRRYFATSRPGLERHLPTSRIDGVRLVYQLQLLSGWARCGWTSGAAEPPPLHRLLLSIGSPEPARQVVFTLIRGDGGHRMVQGYPCIEGHSLVFEWNISEALRIETEAVVDGRFITDHFVLEAKNLLN